MLRERANDSPSYPLSEHSVRRTVEDLAKVYGKVVKL